MARRPDRSILTEVDADEISQRSGRFLTIDVLAGPLTC